MRLISLCLLSALVIGGCGEDEERFEKVDKLRGIGIKAVPSITEASSTGEAPKLVSLTVYAVLPKGQEVTSFDSYTDEQGTFSIPTSVSISLPPSYEDLGPLRLVTLMATTVVPEVKQETIDAFNGVVRFRYGLKLVSGSDEEIVVGDYLVVAKDHAALQWQKPDLQIVEPAGTVSGSPVKLLATVSKQQDEPVKVIWFVSSGKVKNLQAHDTEWEEPELGTQALIFAAFPRRSAKFELVYKTVEIAAP
ncbi:MAG: hypothetical protein HYW48_05365 [Deltaproteobacteria bacterium]|nr:hypothetical protein [Deltaproteobacteria bacterium]